MKLAKPDRRVSNASILNLQRPWSVRVVSRLPAWIHSFRSQLSQDRHEIATISLCELPTEILQYIASLLPIGSAASLALCSHFLYHVIGSQYWRALRQENQSTEKRDFLSYLERDLSSFVFCYRCIQLYHRNPIEGPRYQYRWHRERQCIQEDGVITELAPSYYLKYQHVQLAMKSHRFGPTRGIPLTSLAYTYSRLRQDSWLQVVLRARIPADELLVRAQYTVFTWRSHPNIDRVRFDIRQVCPHLVTTCYDENLLTQLLVCRLDHLDNPACLKCTGLKQCQYCPTEFQIEIEDFGDMDTAVLVTVWKNFGTGTTPLDLKWRAQVHSNDNNPLICRLFDFVPGSIRSAFED